MKYIYNTNFEIEVTVEDGNWKASSIYLPENRMVAATMVNKTEEEAKQFVQQSSDAYLNNKSPYCKRCNTPIHFIDDGWCEPCREALEEEHYENMAQDAYEYPDEQTIINSYRRGTL